MTLLPLCSLTASCHLTKPQRCVATSVLSSEAGVVLHPMQFVFSLFLQLCVQQENVLHALMCAWVILARELGSQLLGWGASRIAVAF